MTNAWCVKTTIIKLLPSCQFWTRSKRRVQSKPCKEKHLERNREEECRITEAKTHETQNVSLNKVSPDKQKQCRLIWFKDFILSHIQLTMFFTLIRACQWVCFMSSSLCRLWVSNSNFNRIRASTSVLTVFEHSASFRRLKQLINHVDTILFCGGKGARNKMSNLF